MESQVAVSVAEVQPQGDVSDAILGYVDGHSGRHLRSAYLPPLHWGWADQLPAGDLVGLSDFCLTAFDV